MQMAEFRIVPTFIAGAPMFEVRRAHRVLWWTVFGFESFAPSRDQAEAIIAHLGGPIISVSTESRDNGSGNL